jgi:quercetin dioxygenase-like cupin family protein
MDEAEIIEKLKMEGFDPVYVYDAQPGEVDEEHAHNFDTKLVILSGDIQITSLVDGVVRNIKYGEGDELFILRNTPHTAKVGLSGCRYVVAEKHS